MCIENAEGLFSFQYHDELKYYRNNSKNLFAVIILVCNKIVYAIWLLIKFKLLTKSKDKFIIILWADEVKINIAIL